MLGEGFITKETFGIFSRNLYKKLSGLRLTGGSCSIPPAPSIHDLVGEKHLVSGLTPGHFLKAFTETTFGFGTVNVNTTSPLGGGGALTSDLTLTVGGLSAIGTANYLVGVNAAGNAWEYKSVTSPLASAAALSLAGLTTLGTTNYIVGVNAAADAWEYKQLLGTTNRVSISHAIESVTWTLPQNIHLDAEPIFQGLTLGPDHDAARTTLVFKSYFDSPVNTVELVAGWVTGEGTGAEGGPGDDPAIVGTEWDLETHEFVAPGAMGLADGVCVHSGILIYHDDTAGNIKGFLTSDGSLDGQTAATSLGNVRGICCDGTYIYVAGFQGGVGAKVKKYLLADYSYVSEWAPVWPTVEYPYGMCYSAGFLYMLDNALTKIRKINAVTMALDSSYDFPAGYALGAGCCTDGTYFYVGAAHDSTLFCNLRLLLSDFSVDYVAADVERMETWYDYYPFYYEESGVERIFCGMESYGGKFSTSTLALYYGRHLLAHTSTEVVVDGAWIYTSAGLNGVDRRYMNDISPPSTEAGVLRFWVNRLGVITEAGRFTSTNLNFTVVGSFVSEVAIGTAPFQPVSTTMCPNLNTDMIDGVHLSGLVQISRQINTTSPLSGGGDLSVNRTLSLAGLSSLGTANYMVGVNAAANAWEYKQLIAGDNVTIEHAAESVTISSSGGGPSSPDVLIDCGSFAAATAEIDCGALV